ncbi:hypothetical protein Q7P37_000913 [Cladosporium fusiforme]
MLWLPWFRALTILIHPIIFYGVTTKDSFLPQPHRNSSYVHINTPSGHLAPDTNYKAHMDPDTDAVRTYEAQEKTKLHRDIAEKTKEYVLVYQERRKVQETRDAAATKARNSPAIKFEEGSRQRPIEIDMEDASQPPRISPVSSHMSEKRIVSMTNNLQNGSQILEIPAPPHVQKKQQTSKPKPLRKHPIHKATVKVLAGQDAMGRRYGTDPNQSIMSRTRKHLTLSNHPTKPESEAKTAL